MRSERKFQRSIKPKDAGYARSLLFFVLLFMSSSIFADNLHPSAARMNAQLGLAYLQKGFYAESKQSLLTALKEDPDIASPWYSMGYYLEKTHHYKAAENDYRYAIKINTDSGAAKNNYGIFLCDQHRYAAAITEFTLAANEPSYLHAGKAYKNAGNCALRIPNKKLALYFFHKAY